jgi:hypothetical protein
LTVTRPARPLAPVTQIRVIFHPFGESVSSGAEPARINGHQDL